MSKVKYNAFYKTREYFLNKLPKGFESLPGWENIIDKMIEETKSPLQEMLERKKAENYVFHTLPCDSEILKNQILSIESIDEQS